MSLIPHYRLINSGKCQFVFKFRTEISARDVTGFKVYVPYFDDIDSTKFPETWYVNLWRPQRTMYFVF